MSAASAISQGALTAIFQDRQSAVKEPILQCVQIKPMESKEGGQERYRLVLSDVSNFIQSMLAPQSNHLITDGILKKGSIVKLKQFNPQVVKGRKIFIVLDLEVLTEFGEPDKIGEPTALDPKVEPAEEKQPAAISGNNFYGNRLAQQQQQQPPQQQNRSLPSRPVGAQNTSFHPIEGLTPWSHRWTIKARCTQKSPIKTWHKQSGEGKLFSVTLLDETGEIRGTGFNDVCDALYDVFQEGRVYYISAPCSVKIAKKQFSNVAHDYELTFERDTVVEQAPEQNDIPQVRFNFTSVGDLDKVEKDTTIDTIGVLKEVGEVNEIVSKTTGKPYQKRELTLVDDSLKSVRLTLWGDVAKNFDAPLESVVAFKGVKVSDFGGRSLSLLSSGTMTVDPDIDEAHKLKGWYDAQGRQDHYTSHAGPGGAGSGTGRQQEYKTISQVKDENIGMNSEAAEYFSMKATVIYVKQDNFAYAACRTEGCNKKVIETEPDNWQCEKCDKGFESPNYRYIMSLNVSDHTGQIWLTCFDESARVVMGKDANELTRLKEEEPEQATEAFAEATCKTYIFRVRARMDSFNDQQRVRYQVQNIYPLDFSRESARLAEIIKQYDLNSNSDSLFV